jgi:hypothetical protein
VSWAGGGGEGGGGGGSSGGGAIEVGWALGAGWAVVEGRGATDVDCPGPVEELPGQTSSAIGTATAAEATAISAILTPLLRYHGSGGARKVNVLLFEARRWPFTVHVLTVGEASRRGGGGVARSTTDPASKCSSWNRFTDSLRRGSWTSSTCVGA